LNPFSLYKLTPEYNAIMQEIEDADGVLSPELDERLEAITKNLATQAVNVKTALDMIGAGKDQIDEWIDKLSRRKEALEREKKRWQDAALQNMSGMGTDVLEGELNGLPVKLRVMESESVVVDVDAEHLPSEYVNIKVTQTPDKKALKAAIQEGKEVPAHIERKQYLRVY